MINIEELLNKIDVDKLIEDYGKEEPVCLDANGVPIRVGDVVYPVKKYGYIPHCDKLTVAKLRGRATFYAVEDGELHDAELYAYRKHDSWEQLEEDCLLNVDDYCERFNIDTCFFTYEENLKAMIKHIIRRAKRLAGVDDE